jgi:hypothetical protein
MTEDILEQLNSLRQEINQEINFLKQRVNYLEYLKDKGENFEGNDFDIENNFKKEMDNIFYSRKKESKYANNDAMFCVRMPSELLLELRQMFDAEKYSSVDGMYVMVRHYMNLYNLDKKTS